MIELAKSRPVSRYHAAEYALSTLARRNCLRWFFIASVLEKFFNRLAIVLAQPVTLPLPVPTPLLATSFFRRRETKSHRLSLKPVPTHNYLVMSVECILLALSPSALPHHLVFCRFYEESTRYFSWETGVFIIEASSVKTTELVHATNILISTGLKPSSVAEVFFFYYYIYASEILLFTTIYRVFRKYDCQFLFTVSVVLFYARLFCSLFCSRWQSPRFPFPAFYFSRAIIRLTVRFRCVNCRPLSRDTVTCVPANGIRIWTSEETFRGTHSHLGIVYSSYFLPESRI